MRFRDKNKKNVAAVPSPDRHIYRHHVCITDTRGYRTYRNLNPAALRVDAARGFIPLWAEDVTLRWRFQTLGFERIFANPEAAMANVRALFGEAVAAWGDACPVKFNNENSVTDFEIVMRTSDDCDPDGCTLASAFFPDGGRHELALYPQLFSAFAGNRAEQIETLVHEIGHIFGLRHFFANISERDSPSRVFGRDNAFSIMNYGDKSRLTDDDKTDLQNLYAAARSGELREIDGAPVKLVMPFSAAGAAEQLGQALTGAESRLMPTAPPIQILLPGRRITIE